MASTDARPCPIKNTAFRAYFDLRLNTGALNSGAAGLDSEVSKDGGTIADCTNEATEIATSSGHYYLDLTSTEMNADSVVVQIKSSTTNAVTRSLLIYPQESGDIKVDVQSYGGTAGTFSGGRPEVNTTHAAGTAWGSGAITEAAFSTAAGSFAPLGIIDQGTAQSASSTTLVGRAALTDDVIKAGMTLFALGSTQGYWQSVVIDSVSGDTFTIAAWPVATPSGTITYKVMGTPQGSAANPLTANVTKWNGTAVATPATAGIPDVNIKNVNNVAASSVTTVNANLGTTQPVNFTGTGGSALAKSDMVDVAGSAVSASTAQLGVNVVNWKGSAAAAMTGDAYARLGAPAGASVSADVAAVKVDTAAILVDTGTTLDARIPAALVGGRMDASVGAMAANVLTATAINTDAITAAKVAADVGTEIGAAVLTAATAAPIAANMEQINTVPVTGDGSGTPFGV